MAMLSKENIDSMGFASVGENVEISDSASFYGSSRIKIGNNVRIDDFCVISAGKGGIDIGNYIHIAVYTSLIGSEKITLNDSAIFHQEFLFILVMMIIQVKR